MPFAEHGGCRPIVKCLNKGVKYSCLDNFDWLGVECTICGTNYRLGCFFGYCDGLSRCIRPSIFTQNNI